MVCKNLPFLDTAMLRFLATSDSLSSDQEEAGLMSLLGMGGGDSDTTPGSDQVVVPRRGADNTDDIGQPGLRRKLLDFEGDFKVECADESGKIDINGLSHPNWFTLPLQQHPVALMLYGLMAPEEYDPLFEERLKIDRWELIGNIKDWVDPDHDRSSAFGGDEDRIYDDFKPRYKVKNKPFDSVEEVRLVAGVADEVWETFGSAFSIHTRNYKINVNTASPTIIRALVRAFSDSSMVPDQRIDARLQPLMIERLIAPFGNADDFIRRVQSPPMLPTIGGRFGGAVMGVPLLATDQMKKVLTTSSTVFKLTATGYVGDSARTVEATLRLRGNMPRYLTMKEY